MKNLFLLGMSLFLIFGFGSAQDLKKVRNAYEKKDWLKAKEAVDLLLTNEKEQKSWEGWFYKGMIYGQIAKSADLKSGTPDAWNQSIEAYQKAMELDPKQSETYMALRSYPIFDNYLEIQKEANELYNNQDYKGALDKYKQANRVGRFIYNNKWALSEVDTVLFYYAGAAAMQSDNTEDAVQFFQKLCDASVSGEGFDMCYRYVTYYYNKKGDQVNTAKYTTLGRKLYPSDTYYDKLDLDNERKNGVGPSLFAKYETVLQRESKDYEIRFDFAAEMFNWLYMDQKATNEEKPIYFEKIVNQLKQCIEIDPKNADAHLLMGKTYFNEAAAIQDDLKTIKGATPADTQKKVELKKKMELRMNESLPYLENALAIFEAADPESFKKDKRLKNEYKNTLYILVDAYRFLGNKEKEQYYDKKYQVLNQ